MIINQKECLQSVSNLLGSQEALKSYHNLKEKNVDYDYGNGIIRTSIEEIAKKLSIPVEILVGRYLQYKDINLAILSVTSEQFKEINLNFLQGVLDTKYIYNNCLNDIITKYHIFKKEKKIIKFQLKQFIDSTSVENQLGLSEEDINLLVISDNLPSSQTIYFSDEELQIISILKKIASQNLSQLLEEEIVLLYRFAQDKNSLIQVIDHGHEGLILDKNLAEKILNLINNRQLIPLYNQEIFEQLSNNYEYSKCSANHLSERKI